LKILYFDIETSPIVAHVWSLWKQNVGLSQIMEPTEVMCLATKWHGEPVEFYSTRDEGGKTGMIKQAHKLLDEADAVVHYNGESFDVPHLNREFLTAGLTPPSPFKQIDLMKAVKKTFRFPSNKLDYVSRVVGLAGKVGHEGHDLWVKCMAGDEDAWTRMEEYNRQDVVLLEEMYTVLRPWIPGHPNVVLYDQDDEGTLRCPACGGSNLTRQGFAYTAVTRFQRYRCECGKWFRDGKRAGSADGRSVAN
jgi:DNA polymerase elongation subunit (family B)